MVKRRRGVAMEPQFFKIILSPHSSQLHIPDAFVMKYGADLRDVVFLEVPSGAIWEVKLQNSNGMTWLKEGWNQFKEYYSIGCGYFLLFQYSGNSHFSVCIFDLSASEIEYPSGPNEDITPENFVNIVGDAHKKKAGRPETRNNSCDDIMSVSLRNKTAKVTKVADHSYSKRQKSGNPIFLPNRVKLEKPDVEEELSRSTQEDKRKETKEKLKKQNMKKNLYCAADRGNEDCNEVLDPSASKMTNTTKCNKRKYSISLEASRYPLRSKQVKLEQSKANGSPSYSGKQRTAASLSSPGTRSERKKSNRMKLEKANSEEDFCCAAPKEKREEINMEKLVKQDRQHNLYGEAYKFTGHCNEVPVVDPSASKVTTTNQHSKKKIAIKLDASNCRYPLRSKQKGVKIEKGDVEENCNKIPVVDPSATKLSTTNRHHEKKTSASLDMSHCRYPLRSKQLNEVKLEKPIAEEDLLYVAQKAKRKKAKNVNLEEGDVEECCKEVPVGDPSATKKTTTNRDTSLDASHCRYPLRSKQLKLEQWEAGGNMDSKTPKVIAADSPYCKRQNSGLPASSPSCQPIRVNLEKPGILFCAAEKSKGKETNNVKLETGDMEGNLNSAAYKGKDSTSSELTNNCQEKGVTLTEAQLRNAIYFNPFFTVSMQPTYVSRNFQLDIPDDFFNKYIKEDFFNKYIEGEETIVNLRVSDGRTWRAKLFIQPNCAKIQSSGWRDFVLGNSLKEHDMCVFELIDGIEPVLDVTIVRSPFPIP
ncbi:hypothetical protein K7X08_032373 [Anisodus acutangulus]|uniref:TF-B3 domain-containing protein n=1 Tax=Anisodus acutangulus TaxID=402998 RepID=A0A9Q1RB05_9SOLA|nr:hypothetical protein K7X08_032373 [Anisodus acutangulus]